MAVVKMTAGGGAGESGNECEEMTGFQWYIHGRGRLTYQRWMVCA